MNMAVSAMVMNLILFAPIVMALWYKKKGTLTTKTICMLLIFMGVILRMIYVFHTDIKVRQYDVHVFFSGHEGHSEYIEYIYNNLKLPDFDPREKWQFYHPPLHHILCAVWLKILNLVGIKIEFGVSTLQYLTVIYSTLFSVFSYKIFKRLEISETALITVIAIVTFHPTMIYLSGSINNDILSSLFAIMAIYYTVKWSQDKKLFDIVKLGLSIGLGMFTKLTVGLIAPAVAVVFLIVFIKNIKQWKKYIAQFALFAVVCCPLGLYWYIRNYIRFGVPLNYVPKLATQSPEFINKPLEYRLMDWSLRQFASPFKQLGGTVEGYLEYNPFVALLKTSMFVDDTFFSNSVTLQGICVILFAVNIVIVAFSLAAMILAIVKNKNFSVEVKTLLGLVFATVFGNYVIFCINYPHACTEHMRYCVPLLLVGTAFLSDFLTEAKKDKGKIYKGSVAVLNRCCVLFCVFSTMFFIALLYAEAANM